MQWEWDAKTRRYRNTDTGRIVARRTILAMRNESVEKAQGRIDTLSAELASGSRSIQSWTLEMRREIKLAWGEQYVFGRGGRRAMTPHDWGVVSGFVKQQHRYLQDFATTVAAGDYSEKKITWRARLYLSAAVTAFEQSHAQGAWGLTLPVHPADGGTPCLVNCRCAWDIRESKAEFRAFWRVNTAVEHCPGCLDRSVVYAPFVVAKTSDS